ncbi:hypothetical protein GOBAR_AA06224 [Gossypium barbadense]|uniref:AMP-dependent synthetase/ligase domain-containing protein n=1 Tax=Gossypium barbadense TaxID=3634 RepID=A0A2P5YFL3_GOSBA|nr:hypothetical protein GOBAR_AA06224 [Gossypium barbadense]
MNYENYDPIFPDQPVVDQYLPLWASLSAFRSKPAFIWSEDGTTNVSNGSTLTYAQLNDSVQSISIQLLHSLQRGDTVIILCTPGLELVEIIFGCQRAGLLSVPIFPPDPSFSKQNHHHLLRALSQTKPKAAIAHHDYITKVQQYLSLPSKDKKLAQMLQNLKWVPTEDVKHKNADSRLDSMSYDGCKPDETYLIQYTSGATGIPKPVLVTAGSAAHNVRTARKAYDLHPNSVIVSWLPQYHDCGLMFLLLTIVSGATCVLTSPAAFVNRPSLWIELITQFKATCTPVPSFTLPLVVKRGGVETGSSPINLWSLRNLIIINEPIYKASVEEFLHVFKPFGLNPSSISPSYGLAENCTFVSTAWRNDDNSGNSCFPVFPSHNKLLPIARLASEEEEEDMDIIVVNEHTHEPVDDGIEGEIWVSSPSNASGYLGHPFLTQDIFKGRLSNKVSRCFVRTGDKGIVKGEERFLFVTGRCAEVIKLPNGQDIHPHYIETAAYNSCPQFIRGGCLAAFDVSRMIAYDGCKPDETYLIQYTSGATGIPKPVLVTAGSAAHNVRTARKAYDLHPNSVIVSWLPQYHDCGLMFLLLTIVSGATCVLTSPAAFVNRPSLWIELITQFKATCTPVPSFTLPLVVKRGGVETGSSPINLWSLRNLIIINEPIYKASVEEFLHVFKPFGLNPSSISPSYGLAENCTFVSTAWRNDDNSGNSCFPVFPSHNKLLPIARLASEEEEEDMDIIVVNEHTHEPVDDGIEGEIWVSSPSNASGYLGHPFLTQDIFKGRLSNKVSRCFVRTGDKGIVKGEERFLFVTGRCAEVIKLPNGQDIHPHYIETAAYNSCPQFIRGGCLAAFDVSRMIALVAEMQRSEKDNKILRNICERIRENVFENEKVDVGMVVLVKSRSVPKTTSGKIQRWAAKQYFLRGKMNALMELKFDNDGGFLRSGNGRGSYGEGEEGRAVIAEEKEEVAYSLSSAPCLARLVQITMDAFLTHLPSVCEMVKRDKKEKRKKALVGMKGKSRTLNKGKGGRLGYCN